MAVTVAVTADAEGVLLDVLGVRWEREVLSTALRARLGDHAGLVAGRLLDRWPQAPYGTHAELTAEIATLLVVRRKLVPQQPGPHWRWPVAPWPTVEALSRGLDLRGAEAEWFADPGGWLRSAPAGRLHHYRRTWRHSPRGTPRLLEAPAPRLAELQRRIDGQVLDPIPVHPAAHGYVRGRSAITFAALHAEQAIVARLDVEGFFSRIGPARIAGLLRTAGYPAAVADVLAGMLITSTPRAVLRRAPCEPGPARRRLLDRLALPHLPQGAPSSPAVANILAYGLDRRLHALAAAVDARYGRYADDLVFSGDTGLPVHGLLARATQIADDEGFTVRPDKTRIMPAHHRQHVTGLVVNAGPAATRRDYDALRALLHNCARTGPDAQNTDRHPAFREHLLGRITWVATGRPIRQARLRELFDRITFD